METVLVTGAGRRLGAAIARRCAAQGWRVLVHHNSSSQDAAQVVADIRGRGGAAETLGFDLADRANLERRMERALDEFGDISALVHSASIFSRDHPDALDNRAFLENLTINAWAPAALSAALLKATAGGAERRIVFVLDQKLANMNPDYSSYTASKAALAAFLSMFAIAYAGAARVFGLAPGLTLASGDQTEEDFARTATLNALQRRTLPEDIAEGVTALLSGPFASGQTFFVDSGQRLLPLHRDVMFLTRAD